MRYKMPIRGFLNIFVKFMRRSVPHGIAPRLTLPQALSGIIFHIFQILSL